MAVSAARGKNFTLRQVTAALSQDFPCKLSFKRTFDRLCRVWRYWYCWWCGMWFRASGVGVLVRADER